MSAKLIVLGYSASGHQLAIAQACIELSNKNWGGLCYPDPEQWRGRGKRKMRKPK